jgi:glucose/arabinose dehydrogenase
MRRRRPSTARRPRRLALALTVALTALAPGSGSAAPMAPGAPAAIGDPAPTIAVSTVLSGLHRPWDLAFTPGGGMLFSERPGPVRFRIASTGVVRTLAVPTDVVAQSEGGMLGVAVDPGFVTNRRVYTCFMSDRGGSLDVRLVRWRINAAVTALTDRVDIVTGIPVSTGRHSGCRPRFGPDGRIWVGTGDAALPTVPQSPTSLGGKVLRVDTSGRGVPGNAPAPFDPRIYTYGHRNVQGIAFSPGGKAYSIEHGTGRDDEVNRLFAGANYGWDPRPLSGPLFYDESRPMTDTARHPGALRAVWSSGDPTIAPSGGTFLSGPRWRGWDRALAMAVLKDQQLRVLRFDPTGSSVVTQWVRITDRGRLRVAVLHPSNGLLYIATDADPGRILRVVPS